MLRINLLNPGRQSAATQQAEGVRNLGIGVGVAGVLILAGLFLYHAGKTKEIDDAKSRNQGVEAQIRQTRSRVADHQRIKDELAEIHAREDAISHLEAARTGPTAMFVEISRMLSPEPRITIDPVRYEQLRHNNPAALENRAWDNRRLWLLRFEEKDRVVKIEGVGRTPDDVGEFMRRMMLSEFFTDVRLQRSEARKEQTVDVELQNFTIVAKVRY